ncbi:guanylate kinase [bacterium]|nr:guanylate kinase [bacterium]
MSGLLVIVSGPSGAGKGTVLKELFAKRADCVSSVSATTRQPRQGEVDGVNYYFLSPETFEQWVEEDRFIEWVQVFKNRYGTPKEFVVAKQNEGFNVVLEIDVQGGVKVMEKIPDCVSIFLTPPSMSNLEKRLRNRGTESEEQISLRLSEAKRELAARKYYKYTVINDTVERAVEDIISILNAENCLTHRVKQVE